MCRADGRVERAATTGVEEEALLAIGRHLTTVPDGFKPHPRLGKAVIEPRRNMMETKKGLDWYRIVALLHVDAQ